MRLSLCCPIIWSVSVATMVIGLTIACRDFAGRPTVTSETQVHQTYERSYARAVLLGDMYQSYNVDHGRFPLYEAEMHWPVDWLLRARID